MPYYSLSSNLRGFSEGVSKAVSKEIHSGELAPLLQGHRIHGLRLRGVNLEGDT